jgi:hypothetical protein
MAGKDRQGARGQEVLFASAGAIAVVGGAAYRLGQQALAIAADVVERAPEPIGATAARLARRGHAEVETAAAKVQSFAEQFAHDFARHPAFINVVTEVVDTVLPGAIDTALPAVFDRLVAEPEGVREVVRAQSTGIAEEVLAQVRSAAGAGDAAVDRAVGRWRHHGDRAVRPKGELAFGP